MCSERFSWQAPVQALASRLGFFDSYLSYVAIWLDVTEGWQRLSFDPAADIFTILHMVLRYLRYVSSWLSFQVRLPQDTFDLFGHTLHDITRFTRSFGR